MDTSSFLTCFHRRCFKFGFFLPVFMEDGSTFRFLACFHGKWFNNKFLKMKPLSYLKNRKLQSMFVPMNLSSVFNSLPIDYIFISIHAIKCKCVVFQAEAYGNHSNEKRNLLVYFHYSVCI